MRTVIDFVLRNATSSTVTVLTRRTHLDVDHNLDLVTKLNDVIDLDLSFYIRTAK